MSAATFKVGDMVTWDSQAAGTLLRKTGRVVEVVPAKTPPAFRMYSTRDHESYVVEVPGKTSRAKPRRYWPLASKLRRAKARSWRPAGVE